jgi:hypothetical protein
MQCAVLRKPSVTLSKSSAKNMQCNGHLNPGYFAEYIGHVILAPQGEDNVAPLTKVTYKVMICAGQTLHKLAVTVTFQGGKKIRANLIYLCTDINNETLLRNFLNSVTSQSS